MSEKHQPGATQQGQQGQQGNRSDGSPRELRPAALPDLSQGPVISVGERRRVALIFPPQLFEQLPNLPFFQLLMHRRLL